MNWLLNSISFLICFTIFIYYQNIGNIRIKTGYYFLITFINIVIVFRDLKVKIFTKSRLALSFTKVFWKYCQCRIFSLFNPIEKHPYLNNCYIVTYVINERMFKIIVRNNREPSELLDARNEDDEDISEQIQMYMGVGKDFHSKPFRLTPKDLGYKQIVLEWMDGTSSILHEDDTFLNNL